MYNHSNNPTYKKNNQNYHHPVTSSKMYREGNDSDRRKCGKRFKTIS